MGKRFIQLVTDDDDIFGLGGDDSDDDEDDDILDGEGWFICGWFRKLHKNFQLKMTKMTHQLVSQPETFRTHRMTMMMTMKITPDWVYWMEIFWAIFWEVLMTMTRTSPPRRATGRRRDQAKSQEQQLMMTMMMMTAKKMALVDSLSCLMVSCRVFQKGENFINL